MEKLRELLDVLERDEESDEGETFHNHHDYKLAAIECEKRLNEEKKLQHKKLLNNIAEIDTKLKERKSKRGAQMQNTSVPGVMENRGNDSVTSPIGKPTNDSHGDYTGSFDKNSNYLNGPDHLDKNNEIFQAFTKLSDLKNQEKVLEEWYSTMSGQLQEEQLKLKDNFEEMRLKILQQKRRYLKTSQQFISNLSSGSTVEGCSARAEKAFIEEGRPLEKNQNSLGVERKNFETRYAEKSTSFDSGLVEARHNSAQVQEHTGKDDKMSVKSFNDLSERILGMSPIHSPNSTRGGARADHEFGEKYTPVRSHQRTMHDKDNFAVRGINLSTTADRTKCHIEDETKENVNSSPATHADAYTRLAAIAKGYLARKLMKTDKVQELVKTIKDTKAVLADMNKEDQRTHKKVHELRADELLRATLCQEMRNAVNKLRAVFMVYTPKEQLALIARSRSAAVERQIKQYSKDKNLTSTQGKRLSMVTRKKLKKRQELFAGYILERPGSSLSLRSNDSTKKQRKSWDVRVFRPQPSNGSPFHYTRSSYSDRKLNQYIAEVPSDESVSQIEGPTESKESVVRKASRKRVIAATLNRKLEASNG